MLLALYLYDFSNLIFTIKIRRQQTQHIQFYIIFTKKKHTHTSQKNNTNRTRKQNRQKRAKLSKTDKQRLVHISFLYRSQQCVVS